jgi:hypothetical protein
VSDVPKRTNPFQKVVATVYAHLSDDPPEESGMLADRLAGTNREVDVVNVSNVLGEQFQVGIEANAAARKLDLTTIDGLLKKHEDIGSHHVIIVSRAGFTKYAKKKIDATPTASGYQPTDLGNHRLETKIVGQLATLWHKRFSVTLDSVFAEIALPKAVHGSAIVPWVRPPPWFPLLDRKGNEVTTPNDLFADWATRSTQEMGELLGVPEAESDVDKSLQHDLLPPWTLDERGIGELYINVDTNIDGGPPTPKRLKLLKLDFRAIAAIRIGRFDLQHKRLKEDIAYSVGEAEIDGEPTLLVVSATEKGEKLTTLRLSQGGAPRGRRGPTAKRPAKGRKKKKR